MRVDFCSCASRPGVAVDFSFVSASALTFIVDGRALIHIERRASIATQIPDDGRCPWYVSLPSIIVSGEPFNNGLEQNAARLFPLVVLRRARTASRAGGALEEIYVHWQVVLQQMWIDEFVIYLAAMNGGKVVGEPRRCQRMQKKRLPFCRSPAFSRLVLCTCRRGSASNEFSPPSAVSASRAPACHWHAERNVINRRPRARSDSTRSSTERTCPNRAHARASSEMTSKGVSCLQVGTQRERSTSYYSNYVYDTIRMARQDRNRCRAITGRHAKQKATLS